MSSKNTTKKDNGANAAASKTSKNVTANGTAKIKSAGKGVVVIELNEPTETDNNGAVSAVNSEATTETSPVTSAAPAKKKAVTKQPAQAKKAIAATPAKKKAVVTSKSAATTKKVKLASSCYHYYRNWLKDFMRSHGVPSARFQKSEDSYDGHITVLENEKIKGLKALEAWNKENPDTKEMFWDIKK
jgi:hypothetical protein